MHDGKGQISFGSSTIAHGNMARTNSNRGAVMPARKRFFEELGLNYDRVALIHPSHSPNIEFYEPQYDRHEIVKRVFIKKPAIRTDFDRYSDGADGLLTFDPTVPVGLVSGDCLPLVVWSSESTLHGILHIGLLGALNGMVSTLPRVLDELGESKDSVRFHIAPTIAAKDYDLATSGLWSAISSQAAGQQSDVFQFIDERGSSAFMDLSAYVESQLLAAGFQGDQVSRFDSDHSAAGTEYFSHHLSRAEGITPRLITAVGFANK